ncbi:MAG: 2Fe-2S iron-sulfur cluster-binding protein [Gammaproteobacteria bacterium]|nr:2Fe-2S iron-sulfur cluster-binding protein [Gammaproteobacteria bacterium]MDH4253445.1 2Fe-2S iron-sulfur cluster-binding protein [Gammaproteobacteria bacterium]MDH5309193.1 2Fe-2S iron-sulfur cluster-binding protein [Gammaproteobacteria bacterium]
MRQYHSLKIASVQQETADSVRIALDVPEELRDEFRHLPGQHLPIEAEIGGKRVRRTYSICTPPGTWPVQIGIRIQPGGQFSNYAAGLSADDTLRVMPPFGQFHPDVTPGDDRSGVAFAAGSGITPIISIIAATLAAEPQSRFTLFYANRTQRSTMFIDDLYGLKNRYPDRLQLVFLFSQEEQEFPVLAGRLERGKVRELMERFFAGGRASEVYVCGPGTMSDEVGEALQELGIDQAIIHRERFGTARAGARTPAPERGSSDRQTRVTVIMDGHRKAFTMQSEGVAIVDAAAEQGIDLPYSCKGGVCATCRTHLREGSVRMDTNYGLEPWELEQGYILACQSHPESEEITLDYDRT